ncbi:hypothetical protein CWI37_0129p0050, partial [Hamiltosporidium tvaerminnensis]
MGIRKYVGCEKQKEKIIKAANRASEADEVIRECKNDQGIPQPSSYTPSTIINNTFIPPSEANTNTKRQEFIRCVFFAVQTRFDRMPRNGWKEIQSYYNEKFSCTETIDVLKRMAHNKTEEEIRQEENGERRRIATCLAKPLSLPDTARFISLREKYLNNIKKISEEEIGKVAVRTRKLPNEL